MNNDVILKRAFIDAFYQESFADNQKFSPIFESQMQRLIQKQKGIYRLVNTVGKRVACIILVILVSLTTTVFSVEALRVPVVKAIENFFVEVKDKLTGTQANNIAVHFTDDITEIVATNYITSIPKEYLINDSEKISNFTKLLSETEWKNPRTEYDAYKDHIFWEFKFKSKDKVVTTVNMCGWVIDRHGTVEIIKDNRSFTYNVSEQTYLDILAFTTRKYYLHKSDLEAPSKKQSLQFQDKSLSGLTEKDIKFISEELRAAHVKMENLLIQDVAILKEPDSPYWYPAVTGKEFTDPFGGESYINGEFSFNGVIKQLENIEKILKDTKSKKRIETIIADLKSACENKDIGSLFTVHESIHDLDYFGINYPAHFDLVAPPDWNGVNTYFGHLS